MPHIEGSFVTEVINTYSEGLNHTGDIYNAREYAIDVLSSSFRDKGNHNTHDMQAAANTIITDYVTILNKGIPHDQAIRFVSNSFDQERLLTDPALSFETPTPTPDDQMREAAAAGLTAASAREVWEQTRALVMTEDFDAVSRDELLRALGPDPENDHEILIDDDNDIDIVNKTHWLQGQDGSEYRVLVCETDEGFYWTIQDRSNEHAGKMVDLPWSLEPSEDENTALGYGIREGRISHQNFLPDLGDEDEGYAL